MYSFAHGLRITQLRQDGFDLRCCSAVSKELVERIARGTPHRLLVLATVFLDSFGTVPELCPVQVSPDPNVDQPVHGSDVARFFVQRLGVGSLRGNKVSDVWGTVGISLRKQLLDRIGVFLCATLFS